MQIGSIMSTKRRAAGVCLRGDRGHEGVSWNGGIQHAHKCIGARVLAFELIIRTAETGLCRKQVVFVISPLAQLGFCKPPLEGSYTTFTFDNGK